MAENINIAAARPMVQPSTTTGPASTPAGEVRQTETAPASGEASKAAAGEAVMSVEELKAEIDDLNELMKQGHRSLSFSVDDSVDEVVVRVVDTETDELVRQIPNEEALKFKQHLEGMLGLLFSDKA